MTIQWRQLARQSLFFTLYYFATIQLIELCTGEDRTPAHVLLGFLCGLTALFFLWLLATRHQRLTRSHDRTPRVTRYVDASGITASMLVEYSDGRSITYGVPDPEGHGFTKALAEPLTVFLCLATAGTPPHKRESVLYMHAVGCPGTAISVLTKRDVEMIETMIHRYRTPQDQPDDFQTLPLFIDGEFPEHPDNAVRQIHLNR